MKPRPYDQRYRDRRGGDLAWFQKANFLLDRGWQRVEGEEVKPVWRDPETGELLTLTKGVERERERRAGNHG